MQTFNSDAMVKGFSVDTTKKEIQDIDHSFERIRVVLTQRISTWI